MITPARMKAPPTSWTGVSATENRIAASAIVQIGSAVLMSEACAAPDPQGACVERLDRDERRPDADPDEADPRLRRDLGREHRPARRQGRDPVHRTPSRS